MRRLAHIARAGLTCRDTLRVHGLTISCMVEILCRITPHRDTIAFKKKILRNTRLSSLSQFGRQAAERKNFFRDKGYKVFGAMEYCSGRLFYQGIAGRFNSDNDHAFLQTILAPTQEHLFLIHDGARYHTRKATQEFCPTHADRITEHPLPAYAPDYNPIADLWKKTKQRATHNQYCKEFVELTVSVDKALTYFATHPDTVLGLFGRYCEESGLELKQAA
jgi:transposase